MLKEIFSTVFLICISISLSTSVENVDLDKLTMECIDAAKRFEKIENSVSYKALHTVKYEGWSGDSNTFKLKYPVVMIIKYAGAEKTGYYWFTHSPQKKYSLNVKVDFNDNYELIEIIEGGHENYRFHGKMKDGIIKGLWEKGYGKKGFAFYVKISDVDGLVKSSISRQSDEDRSPETPENTGSRVLLE